MTEYRAHFDFEIDFANGGSLVGTGFRLDLPSPDLSAEAIGTLLVRHLGLTLVGEVRLANLQLVEEAHRGSRGVEPPPTPTGRRVVDLTHRIRAGLVTYPGLPAPTIEPFLTREDSRARYAPGTEFAMDIITMVGNTGTYLDSPFHRYAKGPDLAGLDLSTMVDQPANVFHLTDAWTPERRGITATMLADRDVRGTAVLLHTGWDKHFATHAYGKGSPFLTEDGVRHLIEAGVVAVGIDSLNVDDTESGGTRPAHSLLLEAGIHVIEHLTNLGELPPTGARFTAAPPPVEDFGTFPVRAYAIIDL